MAKELNEDTTFKMSIKTIGMIAAGIAVVVGGWYSLMQEIQEAKELPPVINVVSFIPISIILNYFYLTKRSVY